MRVGLRCHLTQLTENGQGIATIGQCFFLAWSLLVFLPVFMASLNRSITCLDRVSHVDHSEYYPMSYNQQQDFEPSTKGCKFYNKPVNRPSFCRIFKICLISWVRSFLTTRVTLRSRTITTSSKPIVTMTSSALEA